MSPDAAVAKLVEIVVSKRDFSEDDIYAAMTAAGIPDPIADRVFMFTQIASGRTLLAGLGVRFSPEYFCFNAAGDVVESGQLDEEPYYSAATVLAKQHFRSPGFQQLALMSANVHAINEMLNKGSKATDLITSPAFLFLEAPTEAGMMNARQRITEHMVALQKANPVKKPWWRFW